MGLPSVWLYFMVITIRKFAKRVVRYRNKKITNITFPISTSCVNPDRMNSFTLLFICMVMVNVEQIQLSGSSVKKNGAIVTWQWQCIWAWNYNF